MAIIGNQIISSNYVSDSYSGDGSTVAFTLSLAPASAASISVYVSGLYQIPGSAYTVSGTTLTFTGAPPTGTNNIYVLYLGIKNQNLVPVNGSITPQMLNNANVVFWSTSNNNVGIGTTTPASLLTVGGTLAAGNTTFSGFANIVGASGSSQLTVGNSTGTTLLKFQVTENSGTVITSEDGGTARPVSVVVGSTTAMQIAANGNVGIGTSSPAYKLDVNGIIGNSVGSTTLKSAGGIYLDTSNRIYFYRNGSEIARIDTDNTMSGLSTYRAGAYGTYLGTTLGHIYGTGTASQDAWRFDNANGRVGSIVTSGSSTSYNTSSDYRLKENIQPMQGALATVAQLNPVTYNWKADGSAGQGFIAHELQAVVPDCVTGEKDAVDAEGNPQYQGVDTSFLVATLTAAIQEQQALITALTARVAALEN